MENTLKSDIERVELGLSRLLMNVATSARSSPPNRVGSAERAEGIRELEG